MKKLFVLSMILFFLSAPYAEASVSYRYVKWIVTQRKNASANSIQVSEFETRNGGSSVSWPVGTTASNPGGSNPAGEEYDKAIDGSVSTKWLDFNFDLDGGDATLGSSILIVDTGSGNSVTFDSYRWATANDASERDPVGWSVYGSNNGTDYTLLDSRSSQTITDTRQTYTSDYSITAPTSRIIRLFGVRLRGVRLR